MQILLILKLILQILRVEGAKKPYYGPLIPFSIYLFGKLQVLHTLFSALR